jgi:hypothetical protein
MNDEKQEGSAATNVVHGQTSMWGVWTEEIRWDTCRQITASMTDRRCHVRSMYIPSRRLCTEQCWQERVFMYTPRLRMYLESNIQLQRCVGSCVLSLPVRQGFPWVQLDPHNVFNSDNNRSNLYV